MPHFQHRPIRPQRHTQRYKKRSSKKWWCFLFKWGIIAGAFFFLIGGITFFALLAWSASDLPDPNKIIERDVVQSTKIYDRTGTQLLYEIHGNQRRTVLHLDEIPEYVKWATLAAEDRNFYNHKGFTIMGMGRAMIVNIITGTKSQGGSTITQQLVKNAILTSEKTYTRKFKELILSYQIEQKFSKDQILKLYLNEIPYGSTAYGIQAASHTFFGKDAKDLTLAESATLAAIPKATTFYSPYGNNVDALKARQHYILESMYELDYITEQELNDAKTQELVFQRKQEDITAPHFVMYIKELLTEAYGERTVEQGGLTVITTLDMDAQEAAEAAIEEFGEFNAENYDASNAALVAIDPRNGQVLAMVGSRDYFNADIDGNVNVAIRPRQPGSSMKPLVYTAAFDKGYTDNTILFDVETVFKTDTDDYSPKNYDLEEEGPVSIRHALAGSKNIPAVKATYLVGVSNVLDYADKLGYTTLSDRSRFGLSIVLGGAEVKLLEHVAAFGAFSQDGQYHAHAALLEVKDHKGKILERYKDQSTRVFETQSARLITDVLSDNNARAYAFGQSNKLTLPDRPVAAKTGTTNDYRDGWTVGYTPSLVAGVWAGNNDNSVMRNAGGSKAAAPIWNAFMQNYLKDKPAESFKKPGNSHCGKAIIDGEGGLEETLIIDKVSGKLATEHTPEELREEKTFQTLRNILHYVKKDNPCGAEPQNPESDPQYQRWEEAIARYMQENEIVAELPPTEEDDVHLPEYTPTVNITYPNEHDVITEDRFTATVNASAKRGVSKVEYYIGNVLIGTSHGGNLGLHNTLLHGVSNGEHELRAVAYDDVLNRAEARIPISIQTSLSPSIAMTNIEADTEYDSHDFPFDINVLAFPGSNEYYEGIQKVSLTYSNGQTLSSQSYPSNTDISLTVKEKMDPGTYVLVATMYTEKGNIYSSQPVRIFIKDDKPEPEEA